jgi:hypothetical protein
MTHVTMKDVQRAVICLSHRPCKVLELDPRLGIEAFFWKTVRYIKPPLSAALRKWICM